jgi:hypothetical protein
VAVMDGEGDSYRIGELGAGAAQRADGEAVRRAAAVVAERGGVAAEAGIEPGSEEAAAIVAEIVQSFDPDASRADLADRFEQGADPRAERYWQLLAVINGWPPVPTKMPAWRWTIDALRAPRAG